MKNGFRKILGVVILALAVLFYPANEGSAEAAHFNFGENDIQLTDSLEVQVANDKEASSIMITENGQEIYQQSLSFIQVTDFNLIEDGETTYGIISYRHDGSANALYFEVVELNAGGAELIYTSDEFSRGLLQITDHAITVEYPEYEVDDVMTEPSSFAKQSFSVGGSSVTAGEVKLTAAEEENTARIQGEDKYENYSYTEINRLLTEKALANNIAPEILKAIAYQESGWQHYWETVPNSVKNNCKVDDGRRLAWDGTNAKLGYDCIGIGLMQVSNHMYLDEGPAKDKYVQRLKEDIEFNIDEGIKILLDKWNYKNSTERETGLPIIPTVNDGDAMVIENWYFAILAYNGLLERNNPHTNAYNAYQESVIERMRNFSQVDITPFPTQILEPYHISNGQLRFRASNYQIPGPLHYSSQSLEEGDTAYVNTRSLNLRERPNTGSDVIAGLPKGTKVTITGKYSGNNSRVNQYVWMPVRTSGGQNGYVASSYLASEEYVDNYRLEGSNRFETGVAVSNHGWHWEQPEFAIIGRGDLPIDALTGSVLAAGVDSPLLLTRNDRLTPAVQQELERLDPRYVYILGSNQAISNNIEKQLKEMIGESRVERLDGDLRYDTAKSVADVVASRHNVDEIFVTTGDENSSDSLAIAPVAGERNNPILLTNSRNLSQAVRDYIHEQGIRKVTIIGGNVAVSRNVENQLKDLVGSGNVERIEGDARFDTNIAIIEKYYDLTRLEDVFVAQGMDTADALTASPFAAKQGSPLLLTMSDRVPNAVNRFLNNRVTTSPDLYFLGGDQAISNGVRNTILNLVK